jgi:single-strand selective monofunctional uracil DNA glycosylase
MNLDRLNAKLAAIHFSPPVTHVYNPLEYARSSYEEYCQRYGQGRKKLVMMGMNPGPWGMAQTGIPFGEVSLARDYVLAILTDGQCARGELELAGLVGAAGQGPLRGCVPGVHPGRPIQGFACKRSEVSGRRLWGYLRERYPNPDDFFRFAFVANYCPLLFLEESGRNRTPDKLPKAERLPLLEACNEAMTDLLRELQPEVVVGVGKWAESQAQSIVADAGLPIRVVSVPHPSPANPAANAGWGKELGLLLDELGV